MIDYGELDVGMSRAFGKHDMCGDNKYRQIQVLVIHNDSQFEILKSPYDGRVQCEGMGESGGCSYDGWITVLISLVVRFFGCAVPTSFLLFSL